MNGQNPAELNGVPRWVGYAIRFALFVALAAVIGLVLNRISGSLERSARPAGFARGLLQGALMPMAMPNLLVGNDVMIYSPHNTGLGYKLGYTVGVNVCGAFFFGCFYWRISRWRRAEKRPA
jgi:hypothetical protein